MSEKNKHKDKNDGKNLKASFKLIKGDFPDDEPKYPGPVLLAMATDTRLMGVVGLHLVNASPFGSFHRFFLLDYEEYGIEEYSELISDDHMKILSRMDRMFGALGGSYATLNSREAAFLIRSAAEYNKRDDLDFPEPYSGYAFFVEFPIELSPNEKKALWQKITVPITNDFEAINYYIMRCCGKDEPGRLYLSYSKDTDDPIRASNSSTLYKNIITSADGATYEVQSLVEDDTSFFQITSELETCNCLIKSARRKSCLELSSWEAKLMLKQPEYILYSLCDIDEQTFNRLIHLNFTGITESQDPKGTLYMVFRNDNDHVKEASYRLDRDTLATVILLHSGELLVSSNEFNNASGIQEALVIETLLASEKVSSVGNSSNPSNGKGDHSEKAKEDRSEKGKKDYVDNPSNQGNDLEDKRDKDKDESEKTGNIEDPDIGNIVAPDDRKDNSAETVGYGPIKNVASFKFSEPVLGSFWGSEFDSFDEFLDYMKDFLL